MRRATTALVLAAFWSTGAVSSPSADTAAQARSILEKSIATPTVAGRGEVPGFARWLAGRLRDGGYAEREIEIIPVGETAALLARDPGRDRTLPPLVLSVHMDVVEAKREDWVRDPFQLSEADGFLFGRGVADNKFDLAMLVALLADLRRSGYVPARDIVLALSGDEESTMASTRVLAERLRGAWLVINGDMGANPIGPDGKPQAAIVQAGEKTYASYRLTVTNPGGHSSMPREDNAIYQLAAALGRIGAHRFPVAMNEITKAYLQGVAPRADAGMRAAIGRFTAGDTDAATLATVTSNTEYNAILRTTCVATMLEGGHAENALPQRASATVNCRILPGTEPEAVMEELARVAAEPALQIEPTAPISGSPASPLRKDVFAAIRVAVDKQHEGLPLLPYMSAGATDNKHYRAVGIDSYCVGSFFMRPEDDFSHGLNERVPADAIPGALAFWDALLRELTRG
jgi:acetylornithine deacetylase/succinyl-diaminopimelate desuccinylase-like protein